MRQWLPLQCMLCVLLLTGCASNFSQQEKQTHTYTVQQPVLEPQSFNDPEVIALQQEYRLWLTNASVSSDRIDVLLSIASPSLYHIVELANGATVEMQFSDWFVAGGKIPEDEATANSLELEPIPDGRMPIHFKRPSVHSAVYLGHVYSVNRCEADSPPTEHTTLTTEEYRLFHRFLLTRKIWVEQDYDIAEAAIDQILKRCSKSSAL